MMLSLPVFVFVNEVNYECSNMVQEAVHHVLHHSVANIGRTMHYLLNCKYATFTLLQQVNYLSSTIFIIS